MCDYTILRYCYLFTLYKGSDCRISRTDRNYKGHINVTVSGKPCQLWNKTTDNQGKPTWYRHEEANYCRTPADDSVETPWCYVNDKNMRWELCNVPICSKYL